MSVTTKKLTLVDIMHITWGEKEQLRDDCRGLGKK